MSDSPNADFQSGGKLMLKKVACEYLLLQLCGCRHDKQPLTGDQNMAYQFTIHFW